MNYDQLVSPKGTSGSISNWVNFSDQILPLPDILLDAQTILWDQLRVYDMVATGTFTIAQNTNTAAIPIGLNKPGGLLGVIGMWDDRNIEIKPRLGRNIMQRQIIDAGGVRRDAWPNVYSIMDGQFTFDAGPSSKDMTCRYMYWKQPLFLGLTNETNFLTDRYPHLLRRACLTVAADYLDDNDKFSRYLQLLTGMIQGVSVSNDMVLEGLEADPDYSESRL